MQQFSGSHTKIIRTLFKETPGSASQRSPKNRGRLEPGYWADIVIFDLGAIAEKSTSFQPRQHPEGIPYVFVNGTAVVDQGKFTDATPGKVLTPKSDGWRIP